MEKKSLWESKGHRSFLSDLEKGKFGEKVVISYLESRKNVNKVTDISNTKRGIDDDIDCEIEYADGHTKTIEIKTDLMAHKTGNIVFEEFSHKNPGCFARTKADYILYYVMETNEVYVLNPDGFRAFIKTVKEDAEMMKKLGVRAARMGEGAYGCIIPIKSIKNNTNICESVFEIKFAFAA